MFLWLTTLFKKEISTGLIEGNTLTLQETALVIKEGITIDKKPLVTKYFGHADCGY